MSLVEAVAHDVEAAVTPDNYDISERPEYWVRFILRAAAQRVAYSGEEYL